MEPVLTHIYDHWRMLNGRLKTRSYFTTEFLAIFIQPVPFVGIVITEIYLDCTLTHVRVSVISSIKCTVVISPVCWQSN